MHALLTYFNKKTMVYARYIYRVVQGSSQIVPEDVYTLY